MMGNVVSNRIRNARKALGISQVELAKSCDVTSQTVYKYEAGRVENIPLNTLERFAAVLGVSPAYLAGWTDATSGANKMDVQVKSPTLLCAACPICGSVKFGPKHDNVYGPEVCCFDCGTSFRLDTEQFPLKTVRIGLSLLV